MNPDPHPAVKAFQAWARRNGWTQEELAYECDCNRTNISLVLSGRRPGRYTWRRLVRILPEDGLLLLQQCPTWNKYADEALRRRREREARKAAEARLCELAAGCRAEAQEAVAV